MPGSFAGGSSFDQTSKARVRCALFLRFLLLLFAKYVQLFLIFFNPMFRHVSNVRVRPLPSEMCHTVGRWELVWCKKDELDSAFYIHFSSSSVMRCTCTKSKKAGTACCFSTAPHPETAFFFSNIFSLQALKLLLFIPECVGVSILYLKVLQARIG